MAMLRIWNETTNDLEESEPYALRLVQEGSYTMLQVVNRKGEKVLCGNVLFIEDETEGMVVRLAGSLSKRAGFQLDGDHVVLRCS